MKNARYLKTIALNMLSDRLSSLELQPKGVDTKGVPIELTDEDKDHIVRLFGTYLAGITDRIEARADRSAQKLQARIAETAKRKEKLEKQRATKAEKEQAKKERQGSRTRKPAPKSENGNKAKERKAQEPELATA